MRGLEARLDKIEQSRGGLSHLADEVLDARIDHIAMRSGDKGYALDWLAVKACQTGEALRSMIAKLRREIHECA